MIPYIRYKACKANMGCSPTATKSLDRVNKKNAFFGAPKKGSFFGAWKKNSDVHTL